jgi:predicted helicase
VLYRPFTKVWLYDSKTLIDERGGINHFYPKLNPTINFRYGSRLNFYCVSTNLPSAYAFYSLDPAQYLPLYRYDENGNKIENITDWGLEQFRGRYQTCEVFKTSQVSTREQVSASKEAIFHYVYAVLHNPAYRTKYEQNLKRDFPRIPFYEDFERWATLGKQLMELHINYEEAPMPPEGVCEIVHRTWAGEPANQVEKAPLFNEVKEIEPLYKKMLIPKTKLKADKLSGIIELDEKTYLRGIPAEAWEYKLGNRSALEWVLDQYKESKPSDPTIAEKFNTYRFAEYKEQVIDLLQKVCTVSVETLKIIREMEGEGK